MVEIKKDIYWVGYIDWDLRNFHGYSTPSGSTYNAYLILDEKPTLIDTVKNYGFNEMLSHIEEILSPPDIKYIVSNHAEMDHSGSIEKLLEHCPGVEVVCSPQGKETLRRQFKKDWAFRVVRNNEKLNLGKRELIFFLTPMVHWPDSMASYSPYDKALFSNDAFGQHYASSERFVEECGLDIVMKEASKYYANIVMPYGEQVLRVLKSIEYLAIDMICPSHGLIWRRKEDIEKIFTAYQQWASYESTKRVVIIYDTMWHSTEKIALKLYELIDKESIPVKLCNLKTTDPSDIIMEVLASGILLVGSPILNNRIYPSVGGFLTYLKGLKPKKRVGFSFGSYGWSKAGFRELEEGLKEAGVELIHEGLYFPYIPEEEELDRLKEVVSLLKKL